MREAAKKVNLQEPIDPDSMNVRRDHYFSNAYIIDLPLDSTPDHVWQDLFEREWKLSRHLWERKLFVVGDKLRLVTLPTDIEDKLDWVKQVMERTNQAIDVYNKETRARREETVGRLRRKATAEEERASVETIREIMKKKYG